ncbi:MAG: hypothetical protein RRB13_04160 [bacterium]|nr:hypothetical protein [bacterium]
MAIPNHLGPSIHDLEGADLGQGFTHELPITRNWNEAMNALHYLLLRKWYYVGLVTNTQRDSNKLLKKGVEFSRRRENLDVGLRSILDMKENSYLVLKEKIRHQRIKMGQNRDVWLLGSSWKELPKGTAVIELHQSLLRTLLGKKDVRNAFVILDGKASMTDQNTVMVLVGKIFAEREFALKILEKAKKDSKQPALIKAMVQRETRQPGPLLVKLRDNFDEVMPTLNEAEKKLLDSYFDRLKVSGQHTADHDKLQKSVERAWIKRHEA